VLLLALDTATPAITVALHDGTDVVASSSQVDARRHGELLLPTVDRVLGAAGVGLTTPSPASSSASAPARTPDCASA